MFYVKIEGKTEVVEVKVNASTEYLAVVRATLKYKHMFPVENELAEASEVRVTRLNPVSSDDLWFDVKEYVKI